MATALTFQMQSVPQTGNATQGIAEYGDNGPDNGPDPELSLLAPGTGTAGRTTYNPTDNPDGSWTAGQIAVAMTFRPDGQGNDVVKWYVNGADALTLTIPAVQIRSVDVVAATQTNATVQWSDVHIVFSSGADYQDTYDTGSGGPGVDTYTSSDPNAASDLNVEPDQLTDTEVDVTGTLLFATPAGCYPNPNDLLAEVFVQGV